MADDHETFDEWCLLELFGHRRLAGRVTEQRVAGAAMLRVDVFAGDSATPSLTSFYSSGAIYALTPVTEEVARRFSGRVPLDPPVQRWELEAPTSDSDHDAGTY